MAAISRCKHGGCGLIVGFSPTPDFNVRMGRWRCRRAVAQPQNHEQPLMALKSLVEKRPSDAPCLVGEQLAFYPVDSSRLLQSLDHMRQQLKFDLTRVCKTAAACDENIAHNTLAAPISEEDER